VKEPAPCMVVGCTKRGSDVDIRKEIADYHVKNERMMSTHFAISSVYPGAQPNTGMDINPTVPATR